MSKADVQQIQTIFCHSCIDKCNYLKLHVYLDTISPMFFTFFCTLELSLCPMYLASQAISDMGGQSKEGEDKNEHSIDQVALQDCALALCHINQNVITTHLQSLWHVPTRESKSVAGDTVELY